MIVDAHLHCSGKETTRDVLMTLDRAQVDVGVLLAPLLRDDDTLLDPLSLDHANRHLADLVRGHEDRLIGFAVIDPSAPQAAKQLREAVEKLGLKGVKMVPSGWYPHQRDVQPIFAMARNFDLPILFHSGIFIDGYSGRFCRPVYFEALREHPGLRVTLAHLGWPWTDEALAVGLIDRIHGVSSARAAFRFDISYGAPPIYRLEQMKRALEVLGASYLQFGSDCFFPCAAQQLIERRQWVVDILDQLEVSQSDRDQLLSGTALAWLGAARQALTHEAAPLA